MNTFLIFRLSQQNCKVDKNIVLFGIGNFTDDSIKLSKDCNVGKFVCLSKHDELYNLNTDTSQESTNRIVVPNIPITSLGNDSPFNLATTIISLFGGTLISFSKTS
jgi:hypothetical protein